MSRIYEILNEANERLSVAKCGLAMVISGQGEGRIGIRNVAVFGRMVTFATNNLRSSIANFEAWDTEAKSRHFNNVECQYMYKLRNVIEKEARTPTSISMQLSSFNTNDLNKFERPPGAKDFFIGDQNGGTGWMVEDAEGNQTPYYVSLPSEIGNVSLLLPENDGKDAGEVTAKYVTSLEAYLTEVKSFVEESKK
jgi:hypothetical protein